MMIRTLTAVSCVFIVGCIPIELPVAQDPVLDNLVDDLNDDVVEQAEMTLQAEAMARYRVTFEATWSANTHPNGFPVGPHFSPQVGATHNNDIIFWEAGGIATSGIQRMAELGATGALIDEIDEQQELGSADQVLLGSLLSPSPGSDTIEFEASIDYPLVTLVSMIAPSPDWFVGVSGLSLLDESEQWQERIVVELSPYDAGTDSGEDYTSPNSVTTPQETISRVDMPPFLVDDEVPALGTFTFERLD